MKTNQHLAIIAIEVEIIRLVKVRAYKRVRLGKIERVKRGQGENPVYYA